MSEYEPHIIELEPEKAPRTTAIILLVCGLMGVGFLMVNVFFTGEDPFQSTSWPDDEDGNIQERGNILPNVWRARGEDDEQETVDDQINSRKLPKTATTNPYALPGVEQYMKRPSIAPPPTAPGVPKPVGPGMPNPGTPGRGTTPGGQAVAPGGSAPAK
jgi:hypothetical protein